ncbi:hypothetical protein [Phaeobacter gallaeciensis]|uniref:hypothetical protein n=1 Tax=Phaeobacter gallaeciensis TaxID=60890 RepID=UPI00237F6CBB|nr:hypothetical protein [Phaeobacter gallaeciensis]MDE4368951.1 hypothetical protein [Phaeobacter gallaeciensis]MDE4377889.1 hypothetical protein [Phaeobacter gallaeciensis]MDE4399939.1 hypothetical protein [Phaeobacter gallaeciensis]
MAVSVSIKKTRDPRGKYVFSASQSKRATEEANVRVKRVAEEIAKYLAGQMVEREQT